MSRARLRDWDSTPIVLHFPPVAYEVVEPDQLKGWVDDLRLCTIIEGAGHWIQQERPQEVNAVVLEFLGTLEK